MSNPLTITITKVANGYVVHTSWRSQAHVSHEDHGVEGAFSVARSLLQDAPSEDQESAEPPAKKAAPAKKKASSAKKKSAPAKKKEPIADDNSGDEDDESQDDDEAPTVTEADIRAKIREIGAAKGLSLADAKKVLDSYNCENVSSIPEDRIAEVYDSLQGLLNG